MFVGKSRLVGCIPINSPMKSPKIPDFAQFSPFNPHLPVFFHKFPMDLTICLHISSSFHSHPLGFTRPHIQNARLGTEGTKGEAQATLKLHGAVDLRWGLVFTSLLLWKVWDYTHSPDWLRSKIIYFQTKSASFGGIHLNLQVLVTVDVCFFWMILVATQGLKSDEPNLGSPRSTLGCAAKASVHHRKLPPRPCIMRGKRHRHLRGIGMKRASIRKSVSK